MPDTYLGSNSFNITNLTPFAAGFQNSWTNSLQPGEYDGNQVEEAQAQRITRSMARVLGKEHQMMTLLITLV